MSRSSELDGFFFHLINLPLEPPPAVPLGVWEWLQKREKRIEEWGTSRGTQLSTGFRRQEICVEMELAQRPFVVTAHSLVGEWFIVRNTRQYLNVPLQV
jgi:hypothetical protein